jgi:hypothetical protein
MNAKRAYRGTILVVALGVLAVLALLGATMLKVARVDNLSARSFKYGTSLNMAVESALEWLEYRLVTDYYMKCEGKYYSGGAWNQDSWEGGPFDNPHDPSVPIAMISPARTGRITRSNDVTDRGLYLTSDGKYGAGLWHNLPLGQFMASPGEQYSGHDFDGGIMTDPGPGGTDRLSIRVSGNRTVQISMTVLDLSGRLNLNYHGDLEDFDSATRTGQAYGDPGILISEVAPNWTTSGWRHARAPYDVKDAWHTALANSKRWGDDGKPELADMRMNQFEPSNKANLNVRTGSTAHSPYYNDVPYGLDDLYELLHLNGTEATTRVEQHWPRSFARTGLEIKPDVKMYYKSNFTTHSWVSSARARFSGEEPGGLYVKADLNNGPLDDPSSQETLKENPLRMALLASGLAASYPNAEVDQIVANIMDYRDKDCRPRAIEIGSYTVFGIDAQPYINEVFVDVANAVLSADGKTKTVTVYIELANPYEVELKKDESYTDLTLGADRKSVTQPPYSATIPASIPAGGSVSGKQKGKVIDFTVECPVADNPADLVWPVELHAVAKTTHKSSAQQKEYTIIIDRFEGRGVAQDGESWQRQCVSGKDRAGVLTTYFGGWAARVEESGETCGGGAQFGVNGVDATKIARPVENRSKTPEGSSQKRYAPDEMSFYRIGDIARVMRIGHIPQQLNGNDNTNDTVSERLAKKNETTIRELHVDMLNEKYARIVNFVTVGSQFFDNYDNDGDGKLDEYDLGKKTQMDDNLGPEIYDMVKINLKTARPEIIRAMIPVQLKNRGARSFTLGNNDLWRLAEDICEYGQSSGNNRVQPSGCKLRLPTDILWMPTKYANRGVTKLFIDDGCDDDGNGAVDDYVERTWLYGYMSNWASTRSDCFAVYGTVRLVAGGSGKVEGVRHFLAVLDRVPATAYSQYTSKATQFSPGEANKKYLGMRRVMMTWLD